MNKFKWLVSLSIAGMVLTTSAGVYAGGKLEKIQALKNYGMTIEVDGKVYTPVNANGDALVPISYQGTTYLPIRSVGESLNAGILFDAIHNKVMIETNKSAAAPAASSAASTATSTTSSTPKTPSTSLAETKTPAATSSVNNTPLSEEIDQGPIDAITPEPAAAAPNINMTTGIIQSPYLSPDFPFPADAVRTQFVQREAGDKKQLSFIYTTQGDLNTIGNAYVNYYQGYNINFVNNQVSSQNITIVGTINDRFGISIRANPMSAKPGYNSVSVILAEQ